MLPTNAAFEQRLSDLGHGDHVCMVYDSQAEQMAATVPFILHGLQARERCFYIADDRSVEEVFAALSDRGVDVSRQLDEGSLEILTKRGSYLKNGRFDPAEMIDMLGRSTEEAVRAGFEGFRVAGEMTWALGDEAGCDRLIEYEALLNRFFPGSRALAICQYNRGRFSPAVIRDVLRTHPHAVLGDSVCTNLYYEPPEFLLQGGNDAERVEWMMQQLRRNEEAFAESRRAEEAQGRLAAIVESSQDAIVSKSLDGIIRSWNAGAQRLFGYSPEEAVGKPITMLIPPELLDEERMILERLRRGERVEHFETVRIARDGRRLDISLAISPVRGRDGQVVAASKVARDITQRKRADAALRESEERFRALVTATSDVVFRMNPDWSELRHLDGRDFIADTHEPCDSWLDKYIPPDEQPRLTAAVAEAVRARKTFELEHRIIRVDGGEGWVFSRAIPILDAGGELTGWFGMASDVTRRKQAEDVLAHVTAESERRTRLYEAVLSTTPDLAYVWGLDHRFTYANEGLLRMWGKTWDEAIGKHCLELGYEPWHAEMHDREIEEVRATRKPLRGEVPFAGTFGRRIYDYILMPVIGADGEVEAVAGTTRDVTDRKEMEEELREADRRKDEFIALLAHELRNPLAPIRYGLQVIRLADGDPEATAEARAMMDRQLGHMVRLIDDLLDVSRISRNKLELRKARVALSEVVANAVETARPLIDEAGHELYVSLPQRPVYLNADLTRLAQVFSNLLTNSAKYTPRGGKIWLDAERAGAEVVVSVRDTGIGIPSDALGDIFDMFSQVERPAERSSGGLGIGLALVRGLVEMHGGRVVAASEGEGRGSTFTVALPTIDRVEVPADPGSGNGRASAGLRLLVVDDNRDGAESLAMMLRLIGHEVRTANDGVEAVAEAERFSPAVVLMDVGMPNLDGLDATRRIREQPWGKGMTIIALTGWGQEGDRKRSREAGCDGHLVKPVDLPVLESMLAEALANKGRA